MLRMRMKFGVLMMMVVLLLIPLLALAVDAAPAVDNPVGDALAGLLHGDIRPIIEAFLTAMLGIVLNKVREKTGLQISAERQAQLEALAKQGIGIAEEKAAAYIKTNATKLTGQNKLDTAIAHIIAMAPTVSIEQADSLVHSVLATTPGAGATVIPVT